MDRIRLGGGGARSLLWGQIQADVYGHAVEVVRAEEGAAYGAAILAGVGAGNWQSVENARDEVIQIAGELQPDSGSSQILNSGYAVTAVSIPRFTRSDRGSVSCPIKGRVESNRNVNSSMIQNWRGRCP